MNIEYDKEGVTKKSNLQYASFLLGTTPTSPVTIKKIYYEVPMNVNMTEGVIVEGDNYELNNKILKKIIEEKNKIEKRSFLHFHFHEEGSNQNQTKFSLRKRNDGSYNIYKIPFRYFNKEIFSSIVELMTNKSPTEKILSLFDEFYDNLILKNHGEIIKDDVLTLLHTDKYKNLEKYLNPFLKYISKNSKSSILNSLINNMSVSNNLTYHIYLTEKNEYIFLSSIMYEIRKNIKEINSTASKLGIIIEDPELFFENYGNYSSVYDLFYSWGRTFDTLRILLHPHYESDFKKNKNLLKNHDYNDILNNFEDDGVCHILCKTSKNTKSFIFINKLKYHPSEDGSYIEDNVFLI